MQNFYLHSVTYYVILWMFISEASLWSLNSENNLKMNNDQQKYYISQSSDVEEPEYFWDTLSSTENYPEGAKRIKFVESVRKRPTNQEEYESIERNFKKYPLLNIINNFGRPELDYNKHGILNLQIKTNAKRNADNKDEKLIKNSEFENKIKEMDLADNPDTLVEIFINILKKKYPEKLSEMKTLLDKMASSGELNCSDNNLTKFKPVKDKIQPTTINSGIVSNTQTMKSITKLKSETVTVVSTTINPHVKSPISTATTESRDDENEEEEECDEKEEYSDDDYKTEDELDEDEYGNPSDDDSLVTGNPRYLKKKVGRTSPELNHRKNELKTASPDDFIMSTLKSNIIPTTNLSYFKNDAKIVTQSILTEMDSEEQEDSTSGDVENKSKKNTSKWKLRLLTQTKLGAEISSTETTKPIQTADHFKSKEFIATSVDRDDSLINVSDTVPGDNSSLSVVTTINNDDLVNEEYDTSSQFNSQIKNHANGRKHFQRRNRHKKIRYMNEEPLRYRKKYKGIHKINI